MGMDGGEGSPGADALRRMVATAEILVVQAASDLPQWLGEALADAPRSLLLARGPDVASSLVHLEAARAGEWYVSREIPTSPLAGELSGLDLSGLPPLAELLPPSAPHPGAAPLTVQLRGSGAEEPAMVLLSGDPGRRAVALTSGFWRWALRGGEGRDAYERLWSGVAGWLLANEPLTRVPGVRPTERVVPSRRPVAWTASSLAGEQVTLRLEREGSVLTDTVFLVPEDGRFQTPELEAGTYRYVSTPMGGSGEWTGRLDVTGWTADLAHPRDTTLARADGRDGSTAARTAPGDPLRTHPLPYLLVISLLCAEWIIRRRRGLR